MSGQEKTVIMTMDFRQIWWLFRLEWPEESVRKSESEHRYYQAKRQKFESTFCSDGGHMLRRLIGRSVDEDPETQVPRGRTEAGETSLDAAIRELEEETGIPKSDYRILFDVPPLQYTFTDCGVTYRMTYFLAEYTGVGVDFRFGKRQLLEVDAVGWYDGEQLRAMRTTHINRTAIPLLRRFRSNSRRR